MEMWEIVDLAMVYELDNGGLHHGFMDDLDGPV
jgi:hypothetical protein